LNLADYDNPVPYAEPYDQSEYENQYHEQQMWADSKLSFPMVAPQDMQQCTGSQGRPLQQQYENLQGVWPDGSAKH
jgi:hypothetical protein